MDDCATAGRSCCAVCFGNPLHGWLVLIALTGISNNDTVNWGRVVLAACVDCSLSLTASGCRWSEPDDISLVVAISTIGYPGAGTKSLPNAIATKECFDCVPILKSSLVNAASAHHGMAHGRSADWLTLGINWLVKGYCGCGSKIVCSCRRIKHRRCNEVDCCSAVRCDG